MYRKQRGRTWTNGASVRFICGTQTQHNTFEHRFSDFLGMEDTTGFISEQGRGTHEYRGYIDRVDITTGTLGKALGGASGGYTSGRREIVELLRQRSRPYLFSNSVAPPVVASALKALDLVMDSSDLRHQLRENTARFTQGLEELGFELLPGEHPIVPVMLHDAARAARFAEAL
tara:strand:+ start:9395 stop:9916 length:522 start_codon:yes stop_codon:yes gene_type:complete